MICANPICRHASDYLRDGSLYCIDDADRSTGHISRRFIWLCSACTPSFAVETWRPPGEQLRPLTAAAAPNRAQPDEKFRPLHQDVPREHHSPPRRPAGSHTEVPRRKYAAGNPRWH